MDFFERDQFLSVRARLSELVRPAATFAYITGWRIDSEVLSVEWRQVDFGAGEGDVSSLLREWSDGDQRALALLTPIVHEELRRLAQRACPGSWC